MKLQRAINPQQSGSQIPPIVQMAYLVSDCSPSVAVSVLSVTVYSTPDPLPVRVCRLHRDSETQETATGGLQLVAEKLFAQWGKFAKLWIREDTYLLQVGALGISN